MTRATTISSRLRRCVLLLLIGALSLSLLPSSPGVNAVAQGDAKLIYGVGTTQTPTTRSLSGNTWSAESSLPTANATVRHIITKAGPTRDEFISGVVTGNNDLVIYRWNGANWSEQWRVNIGGSNVPRFDIAYEQVSGRAMVAYSTNTPTTGQIAYRHWNGTSWTSATTKTNTYAGSIANTIRLESRRATNEIAMVWVDIDSTLSANYYNGTSNTWSGEPGALLDNNVAWTGTIKLSSKTFDLAFEDISGELLLVWGNDSSTFPYYVTRSAGPSGTWGTKTSGSGIFQAQGMDMQLAAEPGSNYIAYTNVADYVTGDGIGNERGEAAIWIGTAWLYYNSYDTAISHLEASLVRTSTKWVQSNGQSRAVIVYDDSNAAGVDWLFFNKNTLSWSAIQSDYTSAPTPNANPTNSGAGAIWLYNNPFNTGVLTYVTIDSASALFTKKLTFNGTTLTWSNIESTALKTGLSYRSGWTVSFAYSQYVPPVGSLGIDIVDATGVTITNPAITFSGITSNATCQTSSATLGSSAQKIRVTNTTASAPWTASITATAGTGSTWSSGTATYDFNDATTSGCGDGVDADSVPGQLTVSPAGSTITPQSGCSATGITKGSNASFSQSTVDNVTLLSASSGAATNCYWDLTDVGLSQKIPTLQPVGTYALPMTITVTAL